MSYSKLHVVFALVLVLGALTYLQMPRAKDPEINFNWINIITSLPGASSEDVEKLVTDPLEEAIQKVADIKFVNSLSREGISTITKELVQGSRLYPQTKCLWLEDC